MINDLCSKTDEEIKIWHATGMQPLRHYRSITKSWSYQEGFARIMRRLDGINFKLTQLLERKLQ